MKNNWDSYTLKIKHLVNYLDQFYVHHDWNDIFLLLKIKAVKAKFSPEKFIEFITEFSKNINDEFVLSHWIRTLPAIIDKAVENNTRKNAFPLFKHIAIKQIEKSKLYCKNNVDWHNIKKKFNSP